MGGERTESTMPEKNSPVRRTAAAARATGSRCRQSPMNLVAETDRSLEATVEEKERVGLRSGSGLDWELGLGRARGRVRIARG